MNFLNDLIDFNPSGRLFHNLAASTIFFNMFESKYFIAKRFMKFIRSSDEMIMNRIIKCKVVCIHDGKFSIS